MEEGRLAYRVRTAEAGDATALRDAIGSTLAHPDHQGHRESYSGAAARGDILILERYDRIAHDWQVAGFVECHLRVDDNLSIRDVGTTGDEPQTGVVRYLLDQAFNSFRPVEAQVKIRRDATTWLEIFQAIPGFYLEGEEYRRPHYWTIWRWDRQRAKEAEQAQRPAQQAQRPRPPRPPTPPAPSPGPAQRGPGGPAQRGPGGPFRGGPGPGAGGPAPSGRRRGGPGGPFRGGPGPTSGGPGGPLRGPGPTSGGPGGPFRGGPGPASPNGPARRGPRPSGSGGPARPPGPRSSRPPRRPSRPTNPR